MPTRLVHPFVEFLRDQRTARGISQHQLWREGGPRQTSQSQMETGLWTPTLATVEKYCRALEDFTLVIIDRNGDIRAGGFDER